MGLRIGDNGHFLYPRLALGFLWLAGLSALVFLASVPMEVGQQLLFSLVIFVISMFVRKSGGRLAVLVLMGLSLVVSTRYMWWRLTETMGVGTTLDFAFGLGLVAAEVYAFIVLVFGYFQLLWPLNRKPVPLPADRSLWPSVDVFIPTYNEPLSVVRTTMLASTVLDWPADKLNVYLLDDGRREEFREFCEEIGIHYVTRSNNNHAKAGNINAALPKTSGDFIAIFDCDHVPTSSFLQVTMGAFLKDPKLAVVQTPHYFFSPDPFERNLGTFGRVPNESELFYGLVQDGNDQWNAAFFCGSCAVIKRGPLLEVGGVAVETVTEDAHTALRLHRAGYNSAYLPVPQAAGLATESLSAHVGQRIRWARGMAQILRVDNPLLGKGLRMVQRLCYSNAMLHYFYGLPRIVFLTAPLAYLFFGAHVIQASALMIMVYALPHVIQAGVTNMKVQGRYRHLLWNEVYETALAWYILRPTLMAVINPKLGKFNVTAKGGLVEKSYFDVHIAWPYLLLLFLNIAGVVAGLFRLASASVEGEVGTIWLNIGWTAYNMMLLGATIATSSEQKQLRASHRVPFRMAATLYLPDGRALPCSTIDFSGSGMALQLEQPEPISQGTQVEVELTHRNQSRRLPAVVRNDRGKDGLGIRFTVATIEQERWLVASTFSRADVWVTRWGQHDQDTFAGSLADISVASLRGFRRLGQYMLTSARQGLRPRSATGETR